MSKQTKDGIYLLVMMGLSFFLGVQVAPVIQVALQVQP